MFTILSQEVKKDMMKILLKCTRRPQVEVVEVEDEEDTVVDDVLIVEIENKMVWSFVIGEENIKFQQMVSFLRMKALLKMLDMQDTHVLHNVLS